MSPHLRTSVLSALTVVLLTILAAAQTRSPFEWDQTVRQVCGPSVGWLLALELNRPSRLLLLNGLLKFD
jgi:hypothetical protein